MGYYRIEGVRPLYYTVHGIGKIFTGEIRVEVDYDPKELVEEIWRRYDRPLSVELFLGNISPRGKRPALAVASSQGIGHVNAKELARDNTRPENQE